MKLKKIAVVLLTAAFLPCFAVAGCGSSIHTDAVAATLDGKEIPMGVANFMAQHQAAQIDATFLAYYGEDMWKSDSGSGATMEESVKESVMDNLFEYYVLDAHTADYSVELTEEEKTAITQAASQFLADNGADTLETMSATQETVEEMLRLHTIQSKMRAAISEQIDTNVTDKECAQKTFSYVRFDKGTETAADGGTQTAAEDEDASQEEEADGKAKAEAFLKNAGKDMEAAAKEEDYTVLTCSYGSADLKEDSNSTSMDVAVLKAADKLKDGEAADSVIEAESYYYVIRMDSTDDKEAAKTKKESILNERRSDKYDEVLKSYQDKSEWKINTDEWNKVNFDELYTIKTPETETSSEEGTGENSSGSATGAENTGSATGAENTGSATGAGNAGSATGTDGGSAGTDGGSTGIDSREGTEKSTDGSTAE